MTADLIPTAALLLIFAAVLVLPFRVHRVERNLEIFLFLCGIAALTVAGFIALPGESTGWNAKIVIEALATPLNIATVYGIPIGIVQIVLVVGLLIYYWYALLERAITRIVHLVSVKVLIVSAIIVIGFVSSIISAILAAILLVEMMCALPLDRKTKVDITVVACFAIGMGAGLTPIGEPLTTIVVAKLAGAPYYAGFDFLIRLIGIFIAPAIFLLGAAGYFFIRKLPAPSEVMECRLQRETLTQVFVRAGKVYLFIMALIFLGEGFKPLILEYIVLIPPQALYWVNMVSAVLDNATLAAAEIAPALSVLQVKSALLGLLISGGMLIPGNIPNIIAAGKLGITSREWAKIGMPIGVALMAIYFVVLFVPPLFGL
jgi:predicted cation transporter